LSLADSRGFFLLLFPLAGFVGSSSPAAAADDDDDDDDGDDDDDEEGAGVTPLVEAEDSKGCVSSSFTGAGLLRPLGELVAVLPPTIFRS
jgi:hypothetical protein